jgi:hypothetical protein
MNKTPETQIVQVLVFDTSTSPKTTVFDDTFSIPASSGDFRTFITLIFPDRYEVLVRSNDLNIVPYISGITITGSIDTNATFKYGDLFIWEPNQRPVIL